MKFPTLERYWPNLKRASAPQAAFLFLDCQEAFYGGAAGGGKSDALLAGALQYVDVPGYAAIIFRRTFTDLAIPGASMARAEEWLTGKAHWSAERKTWTFATAGEKPATLTFAYLDHPSHMYRYKSAEFQYIAFDELTQFEEKSFEYLFTRLRATEDIPVPLRMRAASNPGDIGHGWVKRRFVTHRAPGVVFVPAKLSDHPDETFRAGYHESLAKLDDVTRRQMEDGDWDVAAGLAFRLYRDAHIVEPVEIPESWERFEACDFGVSNPTTVGAFAVDYDDNVLVYDSYYKGDTLVSDHATAWLEKRKSWWPPAREGFVDRPTCWADPSMWARTGHVTKHGEPASVVTEFQEKGIVGLVPANNDRRAGRVRITELLKLDPHHRFPAWHPRAGEPGAPRLYFVEKHCPELVSQLSVAPLLPIDSGKTGAGEIVDPDYETKFGHAVAMLRYGAMSRPDASVEPKDVPDDPRAAAVQRAFQGPDENVPWYERESPYADV